MACSRALWYRSRCIPPSFRPAATGRAAKILASGRATSRGESSGMTTAVNAKRRRRLPFAAGSEPDLDQG